MIIDALVLHARIKTLRREHSDQSGLIDSCNDLLRRQYQRLNELESRCYRLRRAIREAKGEDRRHPRPILLKYYLDDVFDVEFYPN